MYTPVVRVLYLPLLFTFLIASIEAFGLHASPTQKVLLAHDGSSQLTAATAFLENGELDSALVNARKAYEHFQNKHSGKDSLLLLGHLYARILSRLNKNIEALEVVGSLISIAMVSGNTFELARNYGLAGVLNTQLFMEHDAKEMHKKSFELFIKIDTTLAYEQLGLLASIRTLPRINELDEALIELHQIYQYLLKNHETDGLAKTMIRLGTVFRKRSIYDSAHFYLQKALALGSLSNETLQSANYQLAWVLMGIQLPQLALSHSEEAHRLAMSLNLPIKISATRIQLSEVHKVLGNFRLALEYRIRADAEMNMAIHRDFSDRISDLKIKYESELNQRKIDALNYKNDLAEKRKIIFGSVILFLFVCIVLLVAHFLKKNQLHKSEMQQVKLKKDKLRQELAFKKNEFASHSLNLIQKEKLLKDVKQNINGMREKSTLSRDMSEELRLLARKLDDNFNIEKTWEDFHIHFEQIHGDFSSNLSRRFPRLSANELRLCSLIKAGLSVKEMAVILNISTQGVKTARYRLRKKFGISREDKLLSFLHSLEHEMLENEVN